MENTKYIEVVNNFSDIIKFNVDIAKYHTFRIKGECDLVVEPRTHKELIKIIKVCKDFSYKFVIIGNGSNILFNNCKYDGILISTRKMNNVEVTDNILHCDGGATLPLVAISAMKNGLSGMEKLSGIPGSIGGAIVMNAGAYGVEMKDILVDATVCDTNYNILTLSKEELDLSYRHSNVKEKKYTVLGCRLKLNKGSEENIKALMNELREKRTKTQPFEYPSAGSIFKREGDIFAGRLIDECGLKGFSIGGAMVSDKHANFIVNKENAKTEDVIHLISIIKETVLKNNNVSLHTEVEII